MKKLNLIILVLVLIGGTAYIGLLSSNKPPVQKPEISAPTMLPDFTLSNISGQPNSIHQIAGDKPTMLIYFSSTCHLCQDELGAISKRIEDFEDYNLILTTVQPLDEMIGFVDDLGIKDKPYVHFLLDAEMKVASYYQIRSVPSIYCYDTNKELVAEYVGITDLDLLLDHLSKGE